jgi:hypothetical protein
LKYRTKPFEIEAVRFTGDNWQELQAFTGKRENSFDFDQDIFSHVEEYWPDPEPEIVAVIWDFLHQTWVGVRSGDYIIKGMKGEFYPCDPQVFEAKYEAIKESNVVTAEQISRAVGHSIQQSRRFQD